MMSRSDTSYDIVCVVVIIWVESSLCVFFFCFQAEDGIRDLVRSRGLGDVYKRQVYDRPEQRFHPIDERTATRDVDLRIDLPLAECSACLLYTSDAADERSSVDLGGRRIIKKKKPTRLVPRTTQSHKVIT